MLYHASSKCYGITRVIHVIATFICHINNNCLVIVCGGKNEINDICLIMSEELSTGGDLLCLCCEIAFARFVFIMSTLAVVNFTSVLCRSS